MRSVAVPLRAVEGGCGAVRGGCGTVRARCESKNGHFRRFPGAISGSQMRPAAPCGSGRARPQKPLCRDDPHPPAQQLRSVPRLGCRRPAQSVEVKKPERRSRKNRGLAQFQHERKEARNDVDASRTRDAGDCLPDMEKAERAGIDPPDLHNSALTTKFWLKSLTLRNFGSSGWSRSFPVIAGRRGVGPGQILDKSDSAPTTPGRPGVPHPPHRLPDGFPVRLPRRRASETKRRGPRSRGEVEDERRQLRAKTDSEIDELVAEFQARLPRDFAKSVGAVYAVLKPLPAQHRRPGPGCPRGGSDARHLRSARVYLL